MKRNLNYQSSRCPGQHCKNALPCDTACKSSTARFRYPIVCTRICSKSEESGNYPLHFFWSTFFTSSDGDPLIGKEIESQQKRKWPSKKVKSGGRTPLVWLSAAQIRRGSLPPFGR